MTTDVPQYQQIQSGASLYLTAVAGTNTITGTLANPTLTAYAAGNTFRFTAASANTGAVTLNINGLGAKAITKNGTTALVSGDIPSGAFVEVGYDGTQFQIINVSSAGFQAPFIDSTALVKGSGDATKLLAFEVDTNIPTATTRTITAQSTSGTMALVEDQIKPINATVAANALTITLNPCSLAFRSATIGSGTVNVRAVNTAITLVVPSTATLGTVNAVQNRLVVLAIDNAGTVELAVVNIAGGNDLTETGIISTTAIAAASNSANIIYSTTARSNVSYRVVGYVESTQATAGTWVTAPSTIQGYGGQALASLSSLGYGQTWQNVTASRTTGTTYYNTTGRPIVINAFSTAANAGAGITINVNGTIIANNAYALGAASAVAFVSAVIPPGASYIRTDAGVAANHFELR